MTTVKGPECFECPKPATVFRAYEGENPEVFLCDDCCKRRSWEKVTWPVKDHPNNPENCE